MIEIAFKVLLTAILPIIGGAFLIWHRQAFWRRHLEIVDVQAVTPTYHQISSKLTIRNQADSPARIHRALVEFDDGEKRLAKASVLPQSGTQFHQVLEPGQNQTIVKWKRASQDKAVSRIRLFANGCWIKVPDRLVKRINDEAANRPR